MVCSSDTSQLRLHLLDDISLAKHHERVFLAKQVLDKVVHQLSPVFDHGVGALEEQEVADVVQDVRL